MKDAIDQSLYQDRGYANRIEYLKSVAEDHGVPYENVYALAELLGPEEDFDGLIDNIYNFHNS